jgi:hypothetical protein
MPDIFFNNKTTPMYPCGNHKHEGIHYCGIFTTDADLLEATLHFILEGIQHNDHVLILEEDKEKVTQIKQNLQRQGVDVERAEATHQVEFSTFALSYLSGGHFSLEKMTNLFKTLEDKAKRGGFNKFRVTAEPVWIFCIPNIASAFLSYERGINDYFTNSDSVAMCGYSRERWSNSFLLDILTAHPKMIHDG